MTNNWNTGDWNTGNCNTGDWNTGNRNTGNWNTGNWNTGDCNTGNWNTGDCNTGNRNTGDWNTGNRNTGDCNTGNWNTGDCNTGDCNTGNCNTGDWNTGDWNTGFFCVETPSPTFFDLPTNLTWDDAISVVPHVDLPVGVEWIPADNMTPEEKADYPNHGTIGGYLKKHELPLNQSFPLAWKRMDKETRRRFINLPNFDADKFLKITGVNVRESEISDEISMLEKRLADIHEQITTLKESRQND